MTSLTQRSSGLVQRRTEASRSAAADKERGAGGGPEDEGRREEPGDDEKGDSKETRLTLMEEVLLLGLKDREVRTVRGGPGRGDAGDGERVWGRGDLPCVGWAGVRVGRGGLWRPGLGCLQVGRGCREARAALRWLCYCCSPAAGTWESGLCNALCPQGFGTLGSPF